MLSLLNFLKRYIRNNSINGNWNWWQLINSTSAEGQCELHQFLFLVLEDYKNANYPRRQQIRKTRQEKGEKPSKTNYLSYEIWSRCPPFLYQKTIQYRLGQSLYCLKIVPLIWIKLQALPWWGSIISIPFIHVLFFCYSKYFFVLTGSNVIRIIKTRIQE